jgi:5-formyltetrahydrofolate cyclo-ligase
MVAYQQAAVLHCYLAIRSEVDTRPLLKHALAAGKRIVVPIVERGNPELAHSWLGSIDELDLSGGVFGTCEPRHLDPAQPGMWDLTIVPLLAFDRAGYRLGYGKGYYDRMLAVAPTPTIGMAFAVQEIPIVPHDPHDVPLSWIVTEQEVIATV